jgi:uncharacterized protein (DUF2147 family)
MRSAILVVCAFAIGCGGVVEPDTSADGAVADAHVDHATVMDAATLDTGPTADATVDPKDAAIGPKDAAMDAPQFSSSVLAYTPFPGLIAADATTVYWAVFAGASGTEISKCAKSGCNKTPTVLWSSKSFSVIGFGLANSSLWFTAGSEYVASCATSGCNGMPTNLLSTLDTVFTAFAVDSNNAYFAGTATAAIESCALSGCAESPTTVATLAHTAYGFAQTDDVLIWSENEDSIEACAKIGCTAPTVLASGRVGATNVATDGNTVYWIELGQPDGNGGYTSCAVMSCALSGCNDAPTAIVSYASWTGATALAADASGVYWAKTQTKQDPFNKILGCANTSCTQPKYYGYTASTSYGIATDATKVYWSDVIGGAIFESPK